jgi:pilus assembly protein CpaB
MITKQVWLKSILAVLLSISIAFYVNQFLQSMSQQTGVVVATVDIPAKTRIESSMLKTVDVNAKDQTTLVPNALKHVTEAVGSVTLVPLKAGDVLVSEEEKLVRPDQSVEGSIEDPSLSKSYFIPPDQRAISLKIDAEGSLGFSLKSGDKVDVIFTSLNMETGGIYAKTILRNITIFEVSSISEKDRQSNTNLVLQNVTLLVSPEEAQMLALSKRKGKIDFILTPLKPDTEEWSGDKPTYPSDIYKEVEIR